MLQILFSVSLSLLLLLCALIYGSCRTWSFRKLARLVHQQAEEALPFVAPTAGIVDDAVARRVARPAISVVVASENDDWWIERHLPLLLQQETTFPFEVVVADTSDSEDETRNIVQRLQTEHPNLRYTFVPPSHRNLYPRKLALTLGVRSARAPWVVVMTPSSVPVSSAWLEHLLQHCTDQSDVVVGYVEATSDLEQPAALLKDVEWQACNLRLWLKHRAASCESTNVVLRKSWALEQGLFTDSLDLPFGECALLVSRAETDRVALCLHPNSFVQQALPDEPLAKSALKREHRLLRRRLAQRGIRPMRCTRVAKTALWFGGIIFLFGAIFRTFQSWPDANTWLQQLGAPLPLVTYDYWQILWDALPLLCCFFLLLQPSCSRRTLRRLFRVTEN